eukprot:scaffold78919_cov24-Tisochrysis_lutea.AAC.3
MAVAAEAFHSHRWAACTRHEALARLQQSCHSAMHMHLCICYQGHTHVAWQAGPVVKPKHFAMHAGAKTQELEARTAALEESMADMVQQTEAQQGASEGSVAELRAL